MAQPNPLQPIHTGGPGWEIAFAGEDPCVRPVRFGAVRLSLRENAQMANIYVRPYEPISHHSQSEQGRFANCGATPRRSSPQQIKTTATLPSSNGLETQFPAFAVIAFPGDAPESLARKGRWCDMPAGERASESTTAVSVCDPSWRPHQRSGKKRMPEFREAQKRISLRRLREGGVARHRREGFLMKPVVELRANASNSPSSSAANARSSLAFDLKNTINIDKFLKTIDQIIIPYSILFQLLTRLS